MICRSCIEVQNTSAYHPALDVDESDNSSVPFDENETLDAISTITEFSSMSPSECYSSPQLSLHQTTLTPFLDRLDPEASASIINPLSDITTQTNNKKRIRAPSPNQNIDVKKFKSTVLDHELNNHWIKSILKELGLKSIGSNSLFDLRKSFLSKYGISRYRKWMKKNPLFEDETDSLLHQEEVGLAKIFMNIRAQKIKFINKQKGYCFNPTSKLWEDIDIDGVIGLVQETVEPIIAKYQGKALSRLSEIFPMKTGPKGQTEDNGDPMWVSKQDYLEKLRERVVRIQSPGLGKQILNLALDPGFREIVDVQQTNLLPIKNGKVIDLRTKIVRDRVAEDYFSFECPVSYIPPPVTSEKDEKMEEEKKEDLYPNAKGFFLSIANGRQELCSFYQQFFGYCLTGENNIKAAFFHIGEASGGKSTVFNIMGKILNEFLQVAPAETMMKTGIKDPRGATPHLIPLVKARVVWIQETGKDMTIDESTLKSHASGGKDPVHARDLYKGAFSFIPHYKTCIPSNHDPNCDVSSSGMMKRLWIFTYDNYFEMNAQNNQYIDNIHTFHLNEIFSWLVEGAYQYYQNGMDLKPPAICQAAIEKFKEDKDTLPRFIEDYCDGKAKSTDFIRSNHLVDAYEQWWDKIGRYDFSAKAHICGKEIQIRMARLYIKERPRMENERPTVFKGIKLLPHALDIVWQGNNITTSSSGSSSGLKPWHSQS